MASTLTYQSRRALRRSFAGASGPRPAPRELSNVEQTPIWGSPLGEDLRARQRRELDEWGWVDRRAGIANIPIDRAMDLLVQRGLPTRTQSAESTPGASAKGEEKEANKK